MYDTRGYNQAEASEELPSFLVDESSILFVYDCVHLNGRWRIREEISWR